MGLKIYDVNNNDALVQTWQSIEHVYIVLDYNKIQDPTRDIIVFDEASFMEHGWKGIYAMEIIDAHAKLKAYLGNNKVKTIVIRTHGGFDNRAAPTDVAMVVDNNKDSKKTNAIWGEELEDYAHKVLKNPLVIQYIDALVGIIGFVKDGGDFVAGSCHSALLPRFILPLQQITNSKVNIYGIKGTSAFWSTSDERVDKITRKKMNGIIFETTHMKEIDNGVANINAKNTLSDTSLLNSDYRGNAAYKFATGWKEGNQPLKLDNLQLNKNGIKATPSKIQDVVPIKTQPIQGVRTDITPTQLPNF